MWIFTKEYKNISSFENFIRLEIYLNTYSKIVIDVLPRKVNKNSNKTVFIFDNYEINITKMSKYKYKFAIYDIDNYPIEYPKLKIGCELETCLDLTCTKMDKSDIATKLSILRSNDKNVEIWSELILRYISDAIIPNLSEL